MFMVSFCVKIKDVCQRKTMTKHVVIGILFFGSMLRINISVSQNAKARRAHNLYPLPRTSISKLFQSPLLFTLDLYFSFFRDFIYTPRTDFLLSINFQQTWLSVWLFCRRIIIGRSNFCNTIVQNPWDGPLQLACPMRAFIRVIHQFLSVFFRSRSFCRVSTVE